MISVWLVTLRLVVRRLAASPLFTLGTAALLGVGLAAAAGFLVVARTVLFEPLPYEDPESLYALRSFNAHQGERTDTLSVADFADLKRESRTFSALTAYRGDFIRYTPRGGSTEQWFGAQVANDFFEVLGIAPLRGRLFQPADHRAGAPAIALLSETAWEREFGRDEAILGQTLDLNGNPVQIVGIVPRKGREPVFAEVWLPFPESSPEYFLRDARYWSVIGRLASGRTAAEAANELKTLSANLAAAYPKTNRHWSFEPVPLLEVRVSGVRQTLVLGTLTATLLLLVTALNLANLLLARGTRRQAEFALHRALGASGPTLAGAALLEAGFISLLGGMFAAVGLALVFNEMVPRLSTEVLPRLDEIEFAWGDLGLLFAITLLAGLLSGLWPALQARRGNLLPLLNASNGRHGQDRTTRRVRGALLVFQVAVTFTLVSAAAVVADQLRGLRAVPLGFEGEDVHAFLIAPDQRRFQEYNDLRGYYGRLLGALREEPLCEEVALTTFPPLFGASLKFSFEIDNYSDPEEQSIEAGIQNVSTGFFEMLSIPVLEGRALNAGDGPQSPPVVVINQALADKYFPDGSAIGRRIRVMSWMEPRWRIIAGVVGTTKQDSLTETPFPQLYLSAAQSPWMFGHLLVRSTTAGDGLRPVVEAITRRVDPELAVTHYTLADLRDRLTARARLLAALMIGFATAACALAGFGVYALVTLGVIDQSREIGIRMALGADRRMILRHYLRSGTRTVAWGTAGGVVLAILADRVLRSVLIVEGAPQPLLFVLAALCLLGLGMLASALPARRAANLSPSHALRLP